MHIPTHFIQDTGRNWVAKNSNCINELKDLTIQLDTNKNYPKHIIPIPRDSIAPFNGTITLKENELLTLRDRQNFYLNKIVNNE